MSEKFCAASVALTSVTESHDQIDRRRRRQVAAEWVSPGGMNRSAAERPTPAASRPLTVNEDRWVDPLARVGLACRGVVYLILAWLSVEVAFGRTSRPADANGAFSAVAAHPLGWLGVLTIGFGLAGLAAWQATIAARRDPGPVRRLAAAGKAAVYICLSGIAVKVVAGHGMSGSDRISGRALAHSWGRVTVGAVGGAIAIGGVVLVWKGVRRRYDVDVDPGRRFAILGVAGMVGRGVVFFLVGALIVDAAITGQPAKARGLDAALRTLAAAPYGRWLLLGVAFGLAAFGFFSAVEARLART